MDKPSIGTMLAGSLVAAALAAAVNLAWAVGYQAATGVTSAFTAPPNIAVSSVVPILLGGVTWWGLARVTGRAPLVMTALAALMCVASVVLGFVQLSLPDGTVKPPGFQAQVQPMHVVVPLAFATVIPWWLRRRRA